MGACEIASLVWPLRARHVTLLARHTPGFKPNPFGHAQTHAPTQAPGVMAWSFSANPSPIPHSLRERYGGHELG
ncbi:hypothetical protein Hanom_Chr05g00427091 [Helianthus anomalus]